MSDQIFDVIFLYSLSATIARGRRNGHLEAFLHSNGEPHLYQHPAIALEPAIGYAKINDDERIKFIG